MKHASAKGKGKVSSDEEEDEESVVSGGGEEVAAGKKSGAGASALVKGKGRVVGSEGAAEKSGAGNSALAKGKGRVVGGEGAAEGIHGGGRDKGVVSEGAGPLVVRIPAPSQVSFPSKTDSVIRALQAKVQRLERDLGKELDKTEELQRLANEVQRLEDFLSTEEERTENLVEAKKKYKVMVKDVQAAAEERIGVLEAAVKMGEADRLELRRKLEEVQPRIDTGLEELRPAVEEYLREKADYTEWRDTGVRRMELAQELMRAEDDRARYLARVLALEREAKEQARRTREREVDFEDLEEELKAMVEKGEAAQGCISELVQSSTGKFSRLFLMLCFDQVSFQLLFPSWVQRQLKMPSSVNTLRRS
jgi:hypothetical protein